MMDGTTNPKKLMGHFSHDEDWRKKERD